MSGHPLEERLGHTFSDSSFLEQALTHTSWSHENRGEHNERLEFLGDAVLEMCTTLLLMEHFVSAREGELSRLRARLVNTEVLADIGSALGVGEHLRLGRGEEAHGGRERISILENTVEALLGAVYSDAGFAACQRVVSAWMLPRIAELDRPAERANAWKDARSLLQEHTQALVGEPPTYTVEQTGGPPHLPTFTAQVALGEDVVGRGEGKTKREASRAAAQAALETFGIAGVEGQVVG